MNQEILKQHPKLNELALLLTYLWVREEAIDISLAKELWNNFLEDAQKDIQAGSPEHTAGNCSCLKCDLEHRVHMAELLLTALEEMGYDLVKKEITPTVQEIKKGMSEALLEEETLANKIVEILNSKNSTNDKNILIANLVQEVPNSNELIDRSEDE